jgi:hypothetical protein
MRQSSAGSQRVDDLALRRKSSRIALGEDLLVVDGDDEDAAAAAHELRVESELFLDLSRQTGGSRKVVSDAAVVDSYVHDSKDVRMLECWKVRSARCGAGARGTAQHPYILTFHIVFTKIAVTLSSPPRSLARSISLWQAFSRSSFSLTARRISSSGTMPVRPSLQRM